MKIRMINSTFRNDFDLIEQELEKAMDSNVDLLKKASTQLLRAGGKRIRPVFVLLSAKFGTYNIQTIKSTAVALELIHMASLVHDDVIDAADLRRGQPTINHQWNDRIALYTGDYILARSLDYITNIENPVAHDTLSKAIIEVCKGEIDQIRDKYCFQQNLRNYLRRIKRKTALLIAVSCELGAVSAGADSSIYKKLYQFGYYIGMSFQITDDILDFTGSEKELGKPAGEDLRQGNITLPALYAMQDESIKAEIVKINEETTKEEMEDIISKIKQSPAIDQSRILSRRYLEKGLEVLDKLPANKEKKALREIALYIGKRTY